MNYSAAMTAALGALLLSVPAFARKGGETRADSFYSSGPEEEFRSEASGSPAGFSGPRRGEFGRGRQRGPAPDFRDLKFKQFRREVRQIGKEMRENYHLIQSLKEELETMEPGVKRAEVKARLNQLRRRQALLKLELARKKAAFTERARDLAESRHRESLRQLEEAEQLIEEEFPDMIPEEE